MFYSIFSEDLEEILHLEFLKTKNQSPNQIVEPQRKLITSFGRWSGITEANQI